jgi:hypothetical protein
MIKVELTSASRWESKIVVDDFDQWCKVSGIKWKVEFYTPPGGDIQHFLCFEKESDATAFRLKYGI